MKSKRMQYTEKARKPIENMSFCQFFVEKQQNKDIHSPFALANGVLKYSNSISGNAKPTMERYNSSLRNVNTPWEYSFSTFALCKTGFGAHNRLFCTKFI